MAATTEDIAKQMLVLLPQDGTSVPNRIMRVMLSRALSADIDEERYLAARCRLMEAGQVALKGGQGGQVYLRSPAPLRREKDKQQAEASWSESRLMPWLKKYLDGPLQRELDILRGAKCLAFDTSTVGRPGAHWARPDFTLISARHFRFLPGIEFDVHSFELKNESGGATDLAVYEALAQTRYTNYGYFVWHVPEGSKAERKLLPLEKQCSKHGIGFIRIREPKRFETWDILLEPVRKPTPAAEIDQFLDERMQEAQRKQIRALLDGAAA